VELNAEGAGAGDEDSSTPFEFQPLTFPVELMLGGMLMLRPKPLGVERTLVVEVAV
jgi:hypothetical protein